MARQILKGLTMLMMTLALAAMSAAVANGQASRKLVAQVPFDFVVAEKTLRAGGYQVHSINQAGDAIAIQSANGDRVLRLTSPQQRNDREMNAKLVFHRYGNTYFLSQIWMAGDSTGRELAKTRAERAIERELKTIASNKPAYEVVEIIAPAR
ncbi:MAG: hypothetical protein ABR607_05400 [Pyrinomonadaceae bacterium]